MSGHKTKLGFFSTREDPPKKKDTPATRTVIGHELHLPSQTNLPPNDLGAEEDQPPIPPTRYEPTQEQPSVVPTPIPVEITERFVRPTTQASHTGKSRFPAIARIFGRWVTGGGFVTTSQLDATEDLVPAQTKGLRTVLLVLAVAVLSFLIVWLLARFKVSSHPPVTPPSATQPMERPNDPPTLPPPAPILAAPSPRDPTPMAPAVKSVESVTPPSTPRIKRAKRKEEPASKPLNPDELMPLWR